MGQTEIQKPVLTDEQRAALEASYEVNIAATEAEVRDIYDPEDEFTYVHGEVSYTLMREPMLGICRRPLSTLTSPGALRVVGEMYDNAEELKSQDAVEYDQSKIRGQEALVRMSARAGQEMAKRVLPQPE